MRTKLTSMRRSLGRVARSLASTGLVWGLVGCPMGGQSNAGTGATSMRVNDSFEGTVDSVEVRRDHQLPSTLVAVRTARHADFDRLVFELTGPLPGYHIEYIDRPVRQCGSGHPVTLAGDAWLQVRLAPANAHDPSGTPTIAARSRRPALPVLEQLELTCDFEANVAWVLGLSGPNAYRVRELTGPPRLVVDVQHAPKQR